MATFTNKLSALLATGRISNLPTVWCNCMVAVLIFLHSSEKARELYFSESIEYPQGSFYLCGLILLISSSFLYVGGCFLGDSIDEKFDQDHKPDRPIPSGILSARSVSITAWTLILIGLLLPVIFHFIPGATNRLLLSNPDGMHSIDYGWQQMSAIPFLALVIILYSILHKKIPVLGLPLIGLCRFFLIITAASIATWFTTQYVIDEKFHKYSITESYFVLPIVLYAIAVCIYTICFASVARTESSDSPITWRAILRYTMLALPLVTLVSHGSYHGDYIQLAAITALAIYGLWMIHAFSYLKINKGIYVSECLAGFCLLDACFVAQFGWIWMIICIVLFLLSLALQKIAPAT